MFDPTQDDLNLDRVKRALRLFHYYAEYFRTTLEHAERIPREGGALIVSNHGPWGIDSPAMFVRIFEETGRVPRGLAEKLIIKLPFIGPLFKSLGAVSGTPENAIQLLSAGHLAVVYPGGHHDSFKHLDQRYKLQWDRARGYLRCALRAGVPIIPIAGIGIDEAFLTLGYERILGRLLFKREDYDLPITVGIGPIPFPVKFRFVVGEPIALNVGPEAADDPETVEALHERVRSTTQALIDEAEAERFHPTAE